MVMKSRLGLLTFMTFVMSVMLVSTAYCQNLDKTKAYLLKAQEATKAGRLQEADNLLMEADLGADLETHNQIMDERLKLKKAMREAQYKASPPAKPVDEPLTEEQRAKIIRDIKSRPAPSEKEPQDTVRAESVKRTQENNMPHEHRYGSHKKAILGTVGDLPADSPRGTPR
jgi:hypothetical protein